MPPLLPTLTLALPSSKRKKTLALPISLAAALQLHGGRNPLILSIFVDFKVPTKLFFLSHLYY
jgi:hypothetical protein